MNLYPEQQALVDRLRDAFRAGFKYPTLQGATGFGKTVTAMAMAKASVEKGNTVFFSVHRRELITQTAKTADKAGLHYGYIAAGLCPNPFLKFQIVSIDTAKNRIGKMIAPNLVLVDEAHLSLAAGWRRVIERWKAQGARIIYLTATPWRLSGEGMGDVSDTMVCGPTTRELIESGRLSKYRLFAPTAPDLAGVHSRAGDFAKNELADAMDTSSITGDAVHHYQKHASGKRAVAFCVSVKHSEHVAAYFRANGIPAAHMDGTTPHHERRQIIRAFADGEIKVICNVEIITTGFDLSAQVDRDVPIEAILLLRPTQSLSLYLQMVGRGLRKKPEAAIILDHAGNALRHGLPCEDRVWTLEGREKNKRDSSDAIAVRQCPDCFAAHRPAPACPECGHVYEIVGRQLDEVDGELQEIAPDELRRLRAREQGSARSAEDLAEVARRRGIKKPGKWADHVLRARQEKQAMRDELMALVDRAMEMGADTVGYMSQAAIYELKPKALAANIEAYRAAIEQCATA